MLPTPFRNQPKSKTSPDTEDQHMSTGCEGCASRGAARTIADTLDKRID